MCDRKFMFGDKSTFGSSQAKGQNMPKNRSTKKIFSRTLNKKSARFLKELGNETLFTICTLLNLKNLKCFFNLTEYKIFLIKSFVITYLLFVSYIYFDNVASHMKIQRFKYVWEPFSHLKCENGSECGIGMDCPILGRASIKKIKKNILKDMSQKTYCF